MYRGESSTSTRFGDVSLFWYMNQGAAPAAPTRGQLMDHIALSVADLDAWIAKLKADRVAFLEQPYTIGDLRAVMIEGPSREAIELVEVKSHGRLAPLGGRPLAALVGGGRSRPDGRR